MICLDIQRSNKRTFSTAHTALNTMTSCYLFCDGLSISSGQSLSIYPSTSITRNPYSYILVFEYDVSTSADFLSLLLPPSDLAFPSPCAAQPFQISPTQFPVPSLYPIRIFMMWVLPSLPDYSPAQSLNFLQAVLNWSPADLEMFLSSVMCSIYLMLMWSIPRCLLLPTI